MMVREGYPSGIEAIEMLVARSGHPRAAFRTMERHAHLDLHHRDDLIDMLDDLPLLEDHLRILEISALYTIQMVMQTNRELLERAATLGLDARGLDEPEAGCHNSEEVEHHGRAGPLGQGSAVVVTRAVKVS
jgi:hypothetical protein